MKLNGKSKKATKYKNKLSQKLTSKSGYSVRSTYNRFTYEYPDYVDYYLKTPNGKIFLGSDYPIL